MHSFVTILLGATLALSVSPVQAQQFSQSPYNGLKAAQQAGIYTSTVTQDDCVSASFPGQRENDCEGGGRHSVLIQKGNAGANQSWEYGVKFLIPADLDYIPMRHIEEFRTFTDDERLLRDSDLLIAAWQRDRPKTVLHSLKLDSELGITFHDRVCANPDQFGTWIDFRMLTRWGEDGYMRVECNGEVIFDEFLDNSINPFCTIQNHCVEDQQRQHSGRAIQMFPGLWWSPSFYGMPNYLPEGGFSIQFKEPYARRTDDPYQARVREVQQALLDAGFDPNGIDGKVGRGTRAAIEAFQAANSVRDREEPFGLATVTALGVGAGEEARERFSVSSFPVVREIRTPLGTRAAPNVARLMAENDLFFQEEYGGQSGKNLVSMLVGSFPGTAFMQPIPITVRGTYDAATRGFKSPLKVQILQPVGKSNVQLGHCFVSLERWPDGYYRAAVEYSRDGEEYTSRADADCARELLPEDVALALALVTKHFDAIAAAAVDSGNVQQVRNKDYRAWLQRVADGAVVLRSISIP